MPEQILQLIVSATGAAVLAAIINAVVNRRKLSAEATEIITKASAGVVENIMADNANLRTRLSEVEIRAEQDLSALRREVDLLREAQRRADQRERAHEIFQERYRHHLERWHRYSARQSEEIRALGGSIEEPPPMWPAPVTEADIRE